MPASAQAPRNVVLILADDLGYGDLSAYSATSYETPNIDRLAEEGRLFTDAHSPHPVCTPTRYGLMTGRYSWRTWAGTANVWSDDPLLIEEGRYTLPMLLKASGYKTAIVGKWHLGYGRPDGENWTDAGVDYNGNIAPGPLEVGFDYYFGIPHVGQQPHVFIQNHGVVGLRPESPLQLHRDDRWLHRTSYLERFGFPPRHHFTGGHGALYDHKELALQLTEKAEGWIRAQAEEQFFLYFAHRNTHGPVIPNEMFRGKSGIGSYGDFVLELDWSVGRILDTLDELGLTEDTLVLFSSDNGAVVRSMSGHSVNGPLRGQKTEAYEGGQRVPLLARWPGRIKGRVDIRCARRAHRCAGYVCRTAGQAAAGRSGLRQLQLSRLAAGPGSERAGPNVTGPQRLPRRVRNPPGRLEAVDVPRRGRRGLEPVRLRPNNPVRAAVQPGRGPRRTPQPVRRRARAGCSHDAAAQTNPRCGQQPLIA